MFFGHHPTIPHILIADQDDNLRHVLRTVLEQEGYTVGEVKTGRDALTALQNTKHTLALLDAQLPDRDGLDVLERLRQSGNDTPVIIMAGNATAAIGIQSMQLGAYDYLPKPFDTDELLAMIQQLLEHLGIRRITPSA